MLETENGRSTTKDISRNDAEKYFSEQKKEVEINSKYLVSMKRLARENKQ